MSVGCQITDGCGPRTTSRSPLCRLRCDRAGMAERNSARTVCPSDVVANKRVHKPNSQWNWQPCCHYKNAQYKIPQTHYRHLPWVQGSAAHHQFTDSKHTLGMCIGSCFVGWPQRWLWAVIPTSSAHSHPEGKESRVWHNYWVTPNTYIPS